MNEIDFPVPIPFLDLAFAQSTFDNGVVNFIPDQLVQAVHFGETIDDFLLMFPDALGKVVGETNVECAVEFVGEDVNGGHELGPRLRGGRNRVAKGENVCGKDEEARRKGPS